jgi:hypothetical protein
MNMNPKTKTVSLVLKTLVPDWLISSFKDINVILTHPLSISKYRESRIPSKAKSDPMDARLMTISENTIKALELLV